MTSVALELRSVTKQFGDKLALDNLSLSVPTGSVFGFLGPNGAGKTTTIRIVAGLARATAGTVRVLGGSAGVEATAARAGVGYLPDVPGFYSWMDARSFLRFAGELFGLSGRTLEERIDVLLDLSGLVGVTQRLGEYSRGMRQRLGLAQALVNAPQLLLLDEPTSALDPLGRKNVLDMVQSLRGRTTVFFSTHILSDVERVCDSVAIINRGRLIAESSMDDLLRQYGRQWIRLEVEAPPCEMAQAVAGFPWLVESKEVEGGLRLAVRDVRAAQKAVPEMLAARGWGLRRFEVEEAGLEDVFVQLVGEAAE